MDRTKWTSPEKLRNIVYGFDVLARELYVFASSEQAIASVEGLTIAEGDYRFFSADGSPMEAHFSVPARVHPERDTYSNGVYTLKPAATGENLLTFLSIIECKDEAASGLATLRDIYEFLTDQAMEK